MASVFQDEPDEKSPELFQDEPDEADDAPFRTEPDEALPADSLPSGSLHCLQDEPDEQDDSAAVPFGYEPDESLGKLVEMSQQSYGTGLSHPV